MYSLQGQSHSCTVPKRRRPLVINRKHVSMITENMRPYGTREIFPCETDTGCAFPDIQSGRYRLIVDSRSSTVFMPEWLCVSLSHNERGHNTIRTSAFIKIKCLNKWTTRMKYISWRLLQNIVSAEVNVNTISSQRWLRVACLTLIIVLR